LFGSKLYNILTAFLTFFMILSYVIKVPMLMVIVVAVLCVMIFLGNAKSSTALLFYFNAFSYIMAYNNYNLYVFVIISYILASLRFGKISSNSFVFIICVISYSLVITMFGSRSYKIGDFISIISLMAVFFVCNSVKQEYFEDVTNSFILGFFITSIIGFFASEIPALNEILTHDTLWISGTGILSVTKSRYTGLTSDTNAFGFICCIVISILLFRKHTKHKILINPAILYFIVVGAYTYSKTYVLILSIILIIYSFQVDRMLLNRILLVVLFVLFVIALDYIFEFDIIKPIIGRFNRTRDSNVSDMTTGRSEIWIRYIKHIFLNGSSVIFGAGLGSDIYRQSEHNTFIECIYKFVAFGTLIWYKYFNSSYNKLKEKSYVKTIKYSWVPLLVCLVYMFVLSSMTFKSFPIIVCMVMFNLLQIDDKSSKLTEESQVNISLEH